MNISRKMGIHEFKSMDFTGEQLFPEDTVELKDFYWMIVEVKYDHVHDVVNIEVDAWEVHNKIGRFFSFPCKGSWDNNRP